MRFPRKALTGADARTDAAARLDEARSEHRDTARRHEAADAGAGEARTSAELNAAGERVAAREAWAEWAERTE
jgi:hypothetical protein